MTTWSTKKKRCSEVLFFLRVNLTVKAAAGKRRAVSSLIIHLLALFLWRHNGLPIVQHLGCMFRQLVITLRAECLSDLTSCAWLCLVTSPSMWLLWAIVYVCVTAIYYACAQGVVLPHYMTRVFPKPISVNDLGLHKWPAVNSLPRYVKYVTTR